MVTAYGAATPTIGSSTSGMKLFAVHATILSFSTWIAIKDPGRYVYRFRQPGTDTFAGTNVLSIVVEVPKSTLWQWYRECGWNQKKNLIGKIKNESNNENNTNS